MEDEDLYRFLADASANVGVPLVRTAEGRTPWEVFKDERFLGNTRVDPCSKILKRQWLDRWLEENRSREDTVCHVGIDWSEEHRFTKLRDRRAEDGWRYEAPLCDEPYLTKKQILTWMEGEGVRPPRLYSMGFPHNNPLSGDALAVTPGGLVPMRGLASVGSAALMGADGRWRRSSVQSYGVQPVQRLRLARGGQERVVRATPDHGWFRQGRDGQVQDVETADLGPGDLLACVERGPDVSEDADLSPWEVLLAEPPTTKEEVFCATVPDVHAFALQGWQLSRNCGGFCIKAGQAQFALLLKAMPERYAYHEKKEEELRRLLGDVSILRDRRGGKNKPLPLAAFRERVETGDFVDRHEWGGCGCFVDRTDSADQTEDNE